MNGPVGVCKRLDAFGVEPSMSFPISVRASCYHSWVKTCAVSLVADLYVILLQQLIKWAAIAALKIGRWHDGAFRYRIAERHDGNRTTNDCNAIVAGLRHSKGPCHGV